MTDERVGRILVVLQFVLIGFLLLPSQGSHVTLPAAALVLLGIALGLLTLTVNPPGNFNIRPTPKHGATLITRGPYRWIRHPMYSAILISGAGLVIGAGVGYRALAWLALTLVLYLKARHEERLLLRHFPDYAQYVLQTRRFLPFLV